MIRRIIQLYTIILLLILFVCSTGVYASASNTSLMFESSHKTNRIKRFTVYTNVIKAGSTAYCCGSDIYKINLKNGKVKTLARNKNWTDAKFTDMKKIGSWIYFRKDGETYNHVYRVSIKSGKTEKIGPKKLPVRRCYIANSWYVISGSKIYFSSIYDGEYEGYFNTVAKLNGKGEKRSKVTIRKYMKRKKTNKKGYKLLIKQGGDDRKSTLRIWLKTPGKNYLLANKTHIYEDSY